MRWALAFSLLPLSALTAAGCRHDIDQTVRDRGVDQIGDAPADAAVDAPGDTTGEGVPPADITVDRSGEPPPDVMVDVTMDSTFDAPPQDATADASGSCAFLTQLSVRKAGQTCTGSTFAVAASLSCSSGVLSRSYSSGSAWTAQCTQSGMVLPLLRCLPKPPVMDYRQHFTTAGRVALCPTGVLVGGGCICAGGVIEESFPIASKNGWRCTCASAGNNDAYVYCADIPASCITIVSANGEESPQCQGTPLLAGGCRRSGGIQTSGKFKTANTWVCGQGAFHAYAVCGTPP